jgi:crotonobetainyl-CoA:carnitine CoA-transferase CaiB-like acyl-CoA transferase
MSVYVLILLKESGLLKCVATRACIEAKFFATFCTLIQRHIPSNFNPPADAIRPEPSIQQDRNKWKSIERWITEAFKTRTRKEWEDAFKGE